MTSLSPNKSINKLYLKQGIDTESLIAFEQALKVLFSKLNEKETEEHLKNELSDFLKDSYYKDKYYINTKGRNDLVIHNGKDAKSSVGVIFEVKRPENKSEMPTPDNLNSKALQELLLYYLRERISEKNIELRKLIITNLREWFIFDAHEFENLFAKDTSLISKFKDFEIGRLAGKNTDLFYNDIAKPFIANVLEEFSGKYTYFKLEDYKEGNNIVELYKVLSPQNLLKLPFAGDSNSLDKDFYAELLHIIGLTEVTQSGKKVIERKPKGDAGSLLENAIDKIEMEGKLQSINAEEYGSNPEEQLFAVSLDLCITWVNRILFLKLLEAQLISYHNADYAFLNIKAIKNMDAVNRLFFNVLAKQHSERKEKEIEQFGNIPYLNSSLFEVTELEQKIFTISSLDTDAKLPLFPNSVLKKNELFKKTEKLTTLEYLLEFLNAYDFGSESVGVLKETNKRLINASVLGLIFEKINGYKDGSFFTPGFITMYMCRETLRKAVLQKFNELKGWDCKDINALYDKIEDRQEANNIINTIRICDPAVGSGHFLVSALNEMIAIKSELGILLDREGKRLRDYSVEVLNDELIITDEDGKFIAYKATNKESQRIQETLFHEKQTIIENCLFGVDLNPNSVKICRLRLWIELLKNAYYKNCTNELETLPNIDINIKCGNSLISRFDLDADLKPVLKEANISIEAYRTAVHKYKNAHNKEEKRELNNQIKRIKESFKTELHKKDKDKLELSKAEGELYNLNQENLFEHEQTQKQIKAKEKAVNLLNKKVGELKAQIEEKLSGKIYQNALEWRFEFPEILNNEGDFVGFDVIIGNPPYIQLQNNGGALARELEGQKYETFARTGDIYSLFYEKGAYLLKKDGALCFITSNKWMRAGYGEATRKFFAEKTNPVLLIDFAGQKIFDSATVDTNILLFEKGKNKGETLSCSVKDDAFLSDSYGYVKENRIVMSFKSADSWTILSPIEQRIKQKIEAVGTPLKDWDINIYRGVLTGYNEAFIIDGKKKDKLIAKDPKSAEIIRPILRGRDIKRYGYDFADLWLINTHNGVKEKSIKRIEIDDYPAIKTHLNTFYPELEKRTDKGDTPYNLRNCAYMEDFYKQKIVYIEIMTDNETEGYPFPCFSYDIEQSIVLNTGYIISSNSISIKPLLAVLNSKVGRILVKNYVSQLQNRQFRMLAQFVNNFPIPYNINSKESETLLSTLVDNILENRKIGESTIPFENEINTFVYKIYNLDEDEVIWIEEQ